MYHTPPTYRRYIRNRLRCFRVIVQMEMVIIINSNDIDLVIELSHTKNVGNQYDSSVGMPWCVQVMTTGFAAVAPSMSISVPSNS